MQFKIQTLIVNKAQRRVATKAPAKTGCVIILLTHLIRSTLGSLGPPSFSSINLDGQPNTLTSKDVTITFPILLSSYYSDLMSTHLSSDGRLGWYVTRKPVPDNSEMCSLVSHSSFNTLKRKRERKPSQRCGLPDIKGMCWRKEGRR